MNDDYLWDKTGQPDPQVQQLEEILGTLRYQPKPLDLPERLPQRRSYFPLLAIAASVLLAIVAGAVWLRMRSRSEVPPSSQAQVEKKVQPAPQTTEEKNVPATTGEKSSPREDVIALKQKHPHRSPAPSFGPGEREEALMAKEQVMLALRLTSEKLNLVHKKTQSITPANQIKNQHRVG
jgi:hypothetical protein